MYISLLIISCWKSGFDDTSFCIFTTQTATRTPCCLSSRCFPIEEAGETSLPVFNFFTPSTPQSHQTRSWTLLRPSTRYNGWVVSVLGVSCVFSFGHVCYKWQCPLDMIESTPILSIFGGKVFGLGNRSSIIESYISNHVSEEKWEPPKHLAFLLRQFSPFMTWRECKSRRKDNKNQWIPTWAWNDVACQHPAYPHEQQTYSLQTVNQTVDTTINPTLPCHQPSTTSLSRAVPYRSCSDGNPTTLSILLWSYRIYLILSNTHIQKSTHQVLGSKFRPSLNLG